MDGYLKIKTRIDNSGVDKGVKQLEDKIKKLQTDNSNLSQEQRALQQEINSYEELAQKADKYKNEIKLLDEERKKLFSNGTLSSGNLTQYNNISAQIDETRLKYAQATQELEKQDSKFIRISTRLERIKAKQTENNAKINEFKQKLEGINTNKIKSGLDGIGKSLQSHIGKIGKIALAVVGIRSVAMGIRRIISLVSRYNTQVSTDLEYMGFVIANTLTPVVEWLVKMLYTVLTYINAIMSAWFGINLFSNASVKAFEKMKNSAGGTAKSMKEIKKSLQSFDEMNLLQDNSSEDGSGGAGISMPSMDLSQIEGEVPEWLKWIIDNKETILSVLGGIASAILAISHGLGLIKSLGIGVMIAGIIYTVQNLIKYLKDPSWKNFGKVVTGIGITILGLGIIIGGVPAIIAGVCIIIVGTIIKYWDEIKGFLQKSIDWLQNKSDWIRDTFGSTAGDIYDMFIDACKNILDGVDTVFTGMKEILDGIIKVFKGIFTGDISLVMEGFKQIFNGVFDAITGTAEIFFSSFGISVKDVFDGIKTALKGVYQVFKGIFTGDMKTVLEGFKTIFKGVFNSLWAIAKYPINSIIRGINTLIRGANRIQIDVPSWIPGIGGRNFGINIPTIPLLAKGGIITHPTHAIIGESGKEAVMPLENNLEWLDILADKLSNKIGDGTVNVYLDGRLILRQQNKRKEQLAFATNGR